MTTGGDVDASAGAGQPRLALSGAGSSASTRTEAARSIWRDCGLILVVCLLVYWLFLGATPFAASEGHRVVPGWTMLDSGDWSRTEMFGLNYVRKPPGMPWAIAASSWLMGETEFAARAPSALACTLMAFVAFGFGRVWCGPKGGLAAGLAQALLPLMWAGGAMGGPGRSAEIEAVNTLFTQIAVFPLIAMMLPAPAVRRSVIGTLLLIAMSAIGILGFSLTKTAASAPCIAGAIIGVCIAARSGWPLLRAGVWVGILLGTVGAYFALRHFAAINNNADAVRETGQFLWQEPRKFASVIPMALVAALPMSLALLLPFGKDAREEGNSQNPAWSRCVLAGRACAFAWVASCAIYAAIGVGNPRYLMPATVFLAPIVGYVVRGMAGGGIGPFALAGFLPDRRGFLKRFIIRGPVAWAGVLVGAAVVINGARAMRVDPVNGRAAGNALSLALPSGATVWADDLIEARPDILLYAERAAAASGRTLDGVWAKPRMHKGELPGPGTAEASGFLLIRTDAESGEGTRYLPAMDDGRLKLVHEGQLGKHEFALFRVQPPTAE